MRKFSTIGIIGAVLAATLALSACGDKKETATTANTAVPGAETKPAEPVPQAKTKEELFNFALQMDGFTVGGDEQNLMANPNMVVFFDPQCEHCSNFWNTTTAVKNLKMKWVPVAILGDRSMILGTNILAASNPLEKMNEHEANFDKGGLKEQTAVEEFKAKVTRNTDFLVTNIEAGIPTFVYRNANGEYGVDKGNQPLERVAQLLGLTNLELKTADNSTSINTTVETPETGVAPAETTNATEAPATEATTPTETTGTVAPTVEDAAKKVVEEAKTVTEDAKKLLEEVKADVKTEATEAVKAVEEKVSK